MKGVSTFYRKLKSGKLSWGYRFDTAPINGERQQTSKSGFGSKKEALRAGMTALQQYENIGQIVSPSDISYSDFLDLWLEKDCAIELKQETVKSYKKRINNHIKPVLGGYHLRAIKRENLQAFILDMFHKGYSRNTLSSLIGIISKSFNWAVDNKYLLYSPAVRIKIPKNVTPKTPTRKSERVYIPADSMKKIFERFPETHPSHIPLKIGYECGVRIGEAFALVWEDIDFKKKTITVNRQIQWQEDKTRTTTDKLSANGKRDCGGGYWYFTNPKYNSFRAIDISDNLIELLKREYERQQAMKAYYSDMYTCYYAGYPLAFNGIQNAELSITNPINSKGGSLINFIFVRENGTYISSRTMQHTSRVIKQSIFKLFSYHNLRHTHDSMLYENNVNEKYIQERLGHKNISMTREYIRSSDISREQGKRAVNSIFR